MNLITIAVEEGYFGVEAKTFNGDTQNGRDDAKAYFREMLNDYDVPYEEESLDFIFETDGIVNPVTSVKVIKSILD